MKFKKLKKFFQQKYRIRMTAGILVIALVSAGIGTSRVVAGKTQAALQKEEAKSNPDGNQESESDNGESASQGEIEEALDQALGDITNTEKPEVGKDENVYIICDAAGTPEKMIVSDWLKNPQKAKTLSDATDLEEIENVKGDETFKKGKGNEIVWEADGSDIYYKGTTKKEAPITQKITYYLNGKEKSPEEIAGASGQVTIRIEYENHDKVTETVEGKEYTVNVPYIVLGGFLLEEDCTNIKVSNGKVISDGKNNIVVGYAMPGLSESLEIEEEKDSKEKSSKEKDSKEKGSEEKGSEEKSSKEEGSEEKSSKEKGSDEKEIPDSIEVSFETESFSLDMAMSVAMTDVLEVNSDGELDLSGIDEKMDEISDATGEMADGADTLKRGMKTFCEKLQQYTAGVSSVKDGATALENGSFVLGGYVHKLTDGYCSLLDQTTQNAASYNTSAGELYENQEAAKAALNNAMTAYVAAQEYYTGYGSALETLEQSSQSVIASAADGILTAAESTGNTELKSVGDALHALSSADYVQMDEKTGNYTVDKDSYIAGLTQASAYITKAAEAVKTSAIAAINGGVDAEVAASAAVGTAVRPQEAESYLTVGEAALASVGQLQAAAATLDTQAGGFTGVYNNFSDSVSARDSAYAALVGSEENPGEAVKVCTYFAEIGAGEALNAVNASLADGGITKEAMQQIAAGADELSMSLSKLKDGVSLIESNNAALNEGAGALNNGSSQLSDGIDEFREKAVRKLEDMYETDAKDCLNRIRAIVKAGEDAQIFTDLPTDMHGSVKYIWRTEAIKEK